jgi:hypothetical protein
MSTGIKTIILLATVIVIAVFIQQDHLSGRLRFESGYIAQQEFAVVDLAQSQSYIYFGNLDGTDILRISSPFLLSDPFIDPEGRLIFTEKNDAKIPVFRLLALERGEQQVICKVLLQSNKYIGSPFVPMGSLHDSILFPSGPFDLEATGLSVAYQELQVFQLSRVSRLVDQRFLSFGNLAQVSDRTFVGVAAQSNMSVSNVLVRIDIRDTLTGVASNIRGFEAAGMPWAVSADQSSGLLYVKFMDYTQTLPTSFIAEVDSIEMKELRTLKLPDERLLSSVFPSV